MFTAGSKNQKIELLSTSMDKSMIIWAPNASGLWTEKARLGEVGGNTLGFYGGKFGAGGSSVMAHGYQGSFHIWNYDKVYFNVLGTKVAVLWKVIQHLHFSSAKSFLPLCQLRHIKISLTFKIRIRLGQPSFRAVSVSLLKKTAAICKNLQVLYFEVKESIQSWVNALMTKTSNLG